MWHEIAHGSHGTRDSRSVGLSRTAPSRDRLRVVHLGKYYPPSAGGIETHTQTLARVQADLGADVHVVVVNHATTGGRDATFEWLSRTRPAAETDGPVRVSRVGRSIGRA